MGKFMSPFTGFWQHPSSSPGDQTVRIATPNGRPVTIVFDDRLVPHIFAEHSTDAYFAQGYVTAMHRLWQMDLSARATAGRLSEILGKRMLEYDKRQRQLGLAKAAKDAAEKWKENTTIYAHLEAYSDGINAFISTLKDKDLPVEYKLMNFEPEEWTPYRTALFTKSMSAMLGSGEKDAEHGTMLNLLGKELFAEIYPMSNPHSSPVISSDKNWDFEPIALPVDTINEFNIGAVGPSAPFSEYQYGSNNWAVSGAKTKSGAPILCNDPHLKLNLPSIWYECHLITPDQNCYGVSLPGMPGIIIGFNQDIAWGITNAGHDVMDWYQVDWVDEKKTQYWLDGKKVDVEFQIETYLIAGGEQIIDTIRHTQWGPVAMHGIHKDMAMKWMALESPLSTEAGTFLELNRAKNHKDYLNALDHFVTPAQNIIFASKTGDIAITVSGHLPLRKKGQGVFVQNGNTSNNDWPGIIPLRHNPMEFNPVRNFVSSANQVSTDSTYPYFYHGEPYFEDYRGRWLNRQLSEMDQITAQDMMGMQLDNRSLKAMEILPYLLRSLEESKVKNDYSTEEQQIVKKLSEWNYAYEATNETPIYFDLWFRNFYRQTWDEFYAIQDSIPIAWPQSWRTIDLAKNQPSHSFFDLKETEDLESAADITLIAFDKMIQEVQELKAKGIDNWGKQKSTRVRHLANIDQFSRTLFGASGHGDALNAVTSTNGPSWRMIVELSDPIKAWVVYPGGQSGHPGDPHYDDMLNDWEKGKYHEARFVFTPEELKDNHSFTMKMEQP
jgi:penicillin amidase